MAAVADRRSFEKRAKVSGRRDRTEGVTSGVITLGMSGIKSLGRKAPETIERMKA